MLGIVTMAGNALRSFGSIHPAIKWGVVAIVGLLAVEFIAREGIAIYRDMATTPAIIEKTNADAAAAKAQADALTAPIPTFKDVDALMGAAERANCRDGGGTWDASAAACKTK